jgi:hypothetical protein
MKYDEARSQIRTGDLIGVRDVHNWLGRLTIFFTRKPYTHTGVAVWCANRLFMADLNSGRNALHPLSQFKSFDVCSPPAGADDRTCIERAVFDWLANPINYGFLAFFVIGLRCFLGLKTFIHWRKIVVCSGGSVSIYEIAALYMKSMNMNVPPAWLDHNRMLSPGELVEELGPPRLQVRP